MSQGYDADVAQFDQTVNAHEGWFVCSALEAERDLPNMRRDDRLFVATAPPSPFTPILACR